MNNLARPGVDTRQNDFGRRIFVQGGDRVLAGTHTLTGALAADTFNTGYPRVIRSGCILGKVTSTGKLASAIIGQLTSTAAASATTINVSPADAVELVRRVGASGTFNVRGAPTASGTVGLEQVTYSAVNTSTGAITCTATTLAFFTGSWIQAEDGSETIKAIVSETTGIRVIDQDGGSIDAAVPIVASGIVDQTTLLGWPATQTSLQTYMMTTLSTNTNVAFDVQV